MINKVFSIKDVVSDQFLGINMCPNKEVFLRGLRSLLSDVNGTTDIQKFPEDYAVYCLGTFDNLTGVFESDIEYIASVKSIKDEMKNYENEV